jgi:exopolyphosphatase/guanosine-5'-triphosphate,3'-diphosphate pyrophosphatase
MKLGVLDIGSNSIHIVVAEITGETQFEIVGRGKDMTRLGDETLKSGWLSRRKMEEGISVVQRFVQLARHRGVQKVLAFATAAVREASNGGEFLDRILRQTGLKVRTITGDEEARLIYLAVRHFTDLSKRRALIVDIGGGSVELIVGSGQVMLSERSLKLGGARLRDLFITGQPVPKSDHERIHRHIEESMEPSLLEMRAAGFEQIVATSGTAINLGSIIHERRTGEPLANPLGFTYTLDELKELHRDLARSTRKELENLPGLDPERRDHLLPGACLLLQVLRTTGRQEIVLCDKAIREGVILDFIQKNSRKIRAEMEIPNVRMRSVIQLATRCEYEAPHARAVARLALRLYDGVPLPAGLRPNARELLEFAAILHDIGYHVSFSKHHKHAYYLIKNAELPGFTPDEVEIIASVARYHRKRPPKERDLEGGGLAGRDRKTAAVLSAVLRVADALDRSHFGVIADLRIRSGRKGIKIRAVSKEDAAMEIWSADRRKDFLEKICGRPISFSAGAATGRRARAGASLASR